MATTRWRRDRKCSMQWKVSSWKGHCFLLGSLIWSTWWNKTVTQRLIVSQISLSAHLQWSSRQILPMKQTRWNHQVPLSTARYQSMLWWLLRCHLWSWATSCFVRCWGWQVVQRVLHNQTNNRSYRSLVLPIVLKFDSQSNTYKRIIAWLSEEWWFELWGIIVQVVWNQTMKSLLSGIISALSDLRVFGWI